MRCTFQRGLRMRVTIAMVLLSLVYVSGFAAADAGDPVIPAASYPALAQHARSAEDFVPAGWRLESKISGDLNGDGRDDVALVPRTTEPSAQDPLDPNGVQAGGVEIKNGTLQVTLGYFSGNMGHLTYTFRFEKGGFKLIGYDSLDVERFSGTIKQLSANYSTRRVKRSLGKISDDADKVTWMTLPPKPLLTMEQIGDGMDFDAAPK